MKTFFGVIALLAIGIVCVGFYQGWFHVTTHTTNQESSTTITVDKDKIRADEGKAKEGIHELGKKVSDKTSDRTVPATEGERQP
jgi:hypothetical protein